jgi:hypothetical protein
VDFDFAINCRVRWLFARNSVGEVSAETEAGGTLSKAGAESTNDKEKDKRSDGIGKKGWKDG